MARLHLVAPRPLTDPAPLAAWLDRIDAVDPLIHAFLPEPDRRARLTAEAPAAGPLAGVPVGVKDIFRVDGLPTRAGSALPPEQFAGPEASLVTRLRSAGAVVAGKTVTAEFASVAPGPTVNPHDPAHTPGGLQQRLGGGRRGRDGAGRARHADARLGDPAGGVLRRGRLPPDLRPGAGGRDAPALAVVGHGRLVHRRRRLRGPDRLIACPSWTPEAPAGRRCSACRAGLSRPGRHAARQRSRTAGRAARRGFVVRTTSFCPMWTRTRSGWSRSTGSSWPAPTRTWFPAYGDRYRPQTAAALREGQAITPTTTRRRPLAT